MTCIIRDRLAPILLSFLLVGACGGEEPPDAPPDTPDAPDTVAPAVVGAVPEDGEEGVFLEASIAIAFSEPMDRASVEGAWTSELLPAEAVRFGWNDAGTELTVQPRAALDPGMIFTVGIDTSAKDLAGNAIEAPFTSVFRTAAVLTLDLAPKAGVSGTEFNNSTNSSNVWVGDSGNGLQYMPVVSFDLAELPDTTLHVVSATLSGFQNSVTGSPYEKLGGKIRASSVSFDALAQADEAEVHGEIGVSSDSSALSERVLDVTDAVRNDWELQEAGNGLSQFRFLFDVATDGDATFDYATFGVAGFELEVTVYVLPPAT